MSNITRREMSGFLVGSGVLLTTTVLDSHIVEAATRYWFVDSAHFRKGLHLHVWVRLVNRTSLNADVLFHASVTHASDGSQVLSTIAATSRALVSHNTRLKIVLPAIPIAAKPLYCCIGHPAGGAPLRVMKLAGSRPV